MESMVLRRIQLKRAPLINIVLVTLLILLTVANVFWYASYQRVRADLDEAIIRQDSTLASKLEMEKLLIKANDRLKKYSRESRKQ